MKFPVVHIDIIGSLPITKFREMDYASIQKFNIPIEIMMESAGLNLAKLVASSVPVNSTVLIGVGTGNNGGGGLVAARRLLAWGYKVFLQIPDKKLRTIPKLQLVRALAYGARIESISQPDIFIDAYLGFLQRLPLSSTLENIICEVNKLDCLKISLDIPTGFNSVTGKLIFEPHIVLTLAAMKTELIPLLPNMKIFIADLGLPREMYKAFGVLPIPEFMHSGVLECI